MSKFLMEQLEERFKELEEKKEMILGQDDEEWRDHIRRCYIL